jgi:hypothetical protein
MAVDTSYLTTQVNNIVEQLHGIYDEIGVPARERDSREAEVRLIQCNTGIVAWLTNSTAL